MLSLPRQEKKSLFLPLNRCCTILKKADTKMFNKQLESHIQEHLDGMSLPSGLDSFLRSLNESFSQYEKKISNLQSTLISKESELTQLNNRLVNETADLKKAHAELSKIFNYVNEGFFTKDIVTDKYIDMSVGCEKIYGYTIDDFFANTSLWYEVIHPEDKVLVEQEREILNMGGQTKNTYRIIHRDNSIRWIEVKAIPLMVDGKLTRVDGVVNDVTERKTAEKALLDNEERYRSLVEQASDAIFINSTSGNLIDANQSACVMLGYTKEEFTRLRIIDLIPGEDSELSLAKFNSMRHGEIVTSEGNLLHHNKSLIPVDISAKMLLDGRVISIVRNLSERRKTEKILLASEEKTRLIMSAALDAIICMDTQDTITFWNPQAEKIFGWKEAEVKGKLLSNLIIPPPFREMHRKGLEKYLVSGHGAILNVLLELSAINRNGEEFPIELTVLPIKQGSEEFFCAFIRDISERKKSENQVIDSERRYRTLFEQNLAGVYQTTSTGHILNCNTAFAKMLGYNSPKELLHSNAVDLYFTPGDREDFMESLRIEKKLYNYEVMLKAKDGSALYMLENISLFQDHVTGEEICEGIIVDITERKKAESLLRESEERYRSLVDQASDAIIINTTKGALLDVNQSACDMLGYSKEEFSAMNLTDLLLPDDISATLSEYQKMRLGETSLSERNIIHRNGSLVPVDISSKILSDGRIISIVRNMSERRIMEKNIRESVERFQRLSQATHDAIWDWNLVTDEVWWNEGFFKLMGFDKDQPIPNLYEWTRKIHPEDRDKVINRLKTVRKNTIDDWEDEFRYEMSDHNYGTVLDRAYVLRDNAGKPIRVIGAIMDITERKKTEQQIAYSEQRYRQIVETAQEGIWMIDENNITTFVNKKMGEILEYAPEDIMGKAIYGFMDEESKKNSIKEIERRMQGVSETHDTVFITSSGKKVTTTISVNPIFDDAGRYKGSLGMVTDITKRKSDEELIKQSEANLDLKNKELKRKNTELEQFAYVASHDLQEPLRTTSSFVKLLQQQYGGKLDEKADKYFNFIIESSDRMKVLINDLLDYSRIGTKKELEAVDCTKVMRDVIADLNKAITDAGALILTDDLPVINGYATEIKQLFQNLTINAIKFRKRDSVLTLHVAAKIVGDFWIFSFADNGIGIDKAHNERIFIIFQRLHTRTEYQGSGIGLSHCKKIVELHHGKIWVESERGVGSTFYFSIPVHNLADNP